MLPDEGWRALIYICAIIGILILLTGLTSAHESPEGWSYPTSCCSNMDCRPVDGPFVKGTPGKVQIVETQTGYQISTTKETIPFNSPAIKESMDGQWHWCSVSGFDNTPTICILKPPESF